MKRILALILAGFVVQGGGGHYGPKTKKLNLRIKAPVVLV
jgi:hypothetical protein